MTIFFGLGFTGRLGNQIMLYCIIRHLEKLHNINIYHSRWIGEQWFQIDKIIATEFGLKLDDIYVDKETYWYDKILNLKNERMPEEISPFKHRFIQLGTSELLLSGKFALEGKTIFHSPRVNMALLKNHEHHLRDILKFKEPYQNMIQQIKTFISSNKKLIVIHVRKGDFNLMVNPYYLFITKFYTKWLTEHFDSNSQLYICGQPTRTIKSAFAKYKPTYLDDVLKSNLLTEPRESKLDIVIDHGLMRVADKVLITNSSFSFTACMLSENPNAQFYRPQMESGKLVCFDPWESYSYDVCPFGWKFFWLYLKYRPWFGIAAIYQVLIMKLKGQKIRDLSY